MPELPEVETTRRGIAPHVVGRRVRSVSIRQPRLRWPVSPEITTRLPGERITALTRRGKYLLFTAGSGTVLLHLGMSGSLRVLTEPLPPGPHDHVDLQFTGGALLRLTDPRRFGAVLWLEGDPLTHPLLASLGPEPLDEAFDGDYLYRRARGRRGAVKNFLMDAKVVVGVGNIYANEALFRAGLNPARAAGAISQARYARLAKAVKAVLSEAIAAGGTTLRDFVDSQGRPGYFAQRLAVYGRGGEACPACGGVIRERRIGQRSSFFCSRCQR